MEPNGWKHSKLPDFAWFQEGPGLRKWQFTDSGCKVINITNIVNGVLDLNKTDRFISYEELNAKYKHFLCDPGDIVIASSGNSYCKHGIIREQDLPLVMNTSVIRFKPLDNCDYEFLNQFLKSKYLKQQIDILITGGAQPNFGPAHLKEVVLSLPPLPEQRKIAKILSTWDQAIATTERLIATSQQQKKALMQQLLTGKKRLVNPETGKVFEGDWKEAKLGDLASKITKGTTPSTNGFQFQEHGINFVKVESVMKSGKFDLSKFAYINEECHSAFKRSQLEQGDILFSIAGALGRTALVTKNILPANTNQALSIVRLKKHLSNVEFVLHYLNSSAVAAIIKGLTAQAAQPNLSLKDVGNLPIELPSVQEQQKIASVLTAADQEIELLEAKLAHLKDEKKALMQQLLTGKRRVNVDATEVA